MHEELTEFTLLGSLLFPRPLAHLLNYPRRALHACERLPTGDEAAVMTIIIKLRYKIFIFFGHSYDVFIHFPKALLWRRTKTCFGNRHFLGIFSWSDNGGGRIFWKPYKCVIESPGVVENSKILRRCIISCIIQYLVLRFLGEFIFDIFFGVCETPIGIYLYRGRCILISWSFKNQAAISKEVEGKLSLW